MVALLKTVILIFGHEKSPVSCDTGLFCYSAGGGSGGAGGLLAAWKIAT
jgi:hypothetical protein